MKNLAKVLMSLVAVMLISLSVSATVPPVYDDADKGGSVTLEVQSYLVFALENEDLDFVYHELTANDPASQITTVMVQSNINWTASVEKTNDVLPAGITLMCEGAAMPAIGSTVDKNGVKTQNVTFTYDFTVTGNPGPATYDTFLSYSIAAQ